jgi:myo-inositol-1-phosphate synthase
MTDNSEQRQRRAAELAAGGGGTVTAKGLLRVSSPNVRYASDAIHARYTYRETRATVESATGNVTATPVETAYHFRTDARPRRSGLMQVGWGGNNGTTVTAAIVARVHGVTWETRAGKHAPNYNGSLTQASTLRVGADSRGRDVFVPLRSVVPMVDPDQLVLGGWDISGRNMADAMDAAGVLEPDLRRQLRPHMEAMTPLTAAFDPSFIAKNQMARADNVMAGLSKGEQLRQLRADIAEFKTANGLEFVSVVWTGNSERYSAESAGVNDTAENLLASIEADDAEVSPSTLYAVAAILEGCPYINGSPQNTFVAGALELAGREGVALVGDDFKSGQTKMKSVLVDYLVGCGVKVKTMVTYNHLGNNDMYQLTDEVMWRPKSASKSRVIEDIVASNGVLYPDGDAGPDHVVVVKYVPFLGDSKRDVSEYVSEAFMDAPYTSIMHNECLDSALCAPLIVDLAVLSELFSRVRYAAGDATAGATADSSDGAAYASMAPVLSVLGFYMKIPRVPRGEPIVNALGRQRACLENMLRALVGLPPEGNLLLSTKCPLAGTQQ